MDIVVQMQWHHTALKFIIVLKLYFVYCIFSVYSKMTTTSSQYEPMELDEGEYDVKPQGTTVRRNLFGPVDHQQLQQDFHRLLSMSVEVAKQRWNFDFKTERPTPGSVEWEEIRCQDVPAFYRSSVVRAGKRKLEVPIKAGKNLAYRGVELDKRAVKFRQAAITGEQDLSQNLLNVCNFVVTMRTVRCIIKPALGLYNTCFSV